MKFSVSKVDRGGIVIIVDAVRLTDLDARQRHEDESETHRSCGGRTEKLGFLF
jgi:hypothetical protein